MNHMNRQRGLLIRATAAVVLVSSAWAGEGVVRIADRPALAPFGSIQQAIDVAIDGETLILSDGLYSGFVIDNRKLALIAAPDASVVVDGTTVVANVGPQRSVVLAGLEFTGNTIANKSLPGLQLDDNSGGVWILNCAVTGGAGLVGPTNSFHGHGGDAIAMTNCARVAIARCMLVAGDGGNETNPSAETGLGGDGGAAVRATSSSLALYSTAAFGGKGGKGGSRGGHGGDGIELISSGLYLGGGVARGGAGGLTLDFIVLDGANGGHGVEADVISQARFVESTLSGGAAGACSACSVDGTPGSPSFGAGVFIFYAGVARTFSATRILGDTELWGVQANGVAGDLVFVTEDDKPTFSASQPVLGVTLIPTPPNLRAYFVGRIPASGVLNATIRLPVLNVGVSAKTRFAQGVVVDAIGTKWPATPMIRTQLDRDGGADCDANGFNDILQAIYMLAPDVDRDLAPDSCALDCNLNGVSDVLETRNGSVADVDDDLIPDSCELNNIWHVDATAPQGGDGSFASPFQALRPAVGATIPGDTVLLYDGVYDRSDSREVDVRGRSITIRSQNGAATTVFDLKSAGRALRMRNNESVLVEGLTFRNGLGVGSGVAPAFGAFGGAILADLATLELADCVFEDNSATGGGAVAMRDGRVVNCRFEHNHAAANLGGSGGGLFVTGSATVVDSLFAHNDAAHGGAVVAGSGAALFDGCRLLQNTATNFGGAISLQLGSSVGAPSVTLANSVVAGNTAQQGGGLFANVSSLTPFEFALHSSTIVGNRASTGRGAALMTTGRANVRLVNTIQRDNLSAIGRPNFVQSFGPVSNIFVDSSDVEGAALAFNTPGGTLMHYAASNFDLDPSFVSPGGADGNPLTFDDNDYRLASNSPCIDAGASDLLIADLSDRDGDGNTVELAPLDLAGAPRRVDDPVVADTGSGPAPALDIGAYERQP